MSELQALLENKHEYIEHLHDTIIPTLLSEFQRIYSNVPKRNSLKEFQDALERLANPTYMTPKEVSVLYYKVLSESGCTYFKDLIKGIMVTYVKIHVLQDNTNDAKVKLRVPSPEKFVQECLIACARSIWKKPHLFYHDIRSIERQNNIIIVEELMKKAINTTIRSFLPLNELFRKFKKVNSSDSESETESEQEEDVTEEEESEEEETEEEQQESEEETEEEQQESEEETEEEQQESEEEIEEEQQESEEETEEQKRSDDEEEQEVSEDEELEEQEEESESLSDLPETKDVTNETVEVEIHEVQEEKHEKEVQEEVEEEKQEDDVQEEKQEEVEEEKQEDDVQEEKQEDDVQEEKQEDDVQEKQISRDETATQIATSTDTSDENRKHIIISEKHVGKEKKRLSSINKVHKVKPKDAFFY
jgi:hypothetical protein